MSVLGVVLLARLVWGASEWLLPAVAIVAIGSGFSGSGDPALPSRRAMAGIDRLMPSSALFGRAGAAPPPASASASFCCCF